MESKRYSIRHSRSYNFNGVEWDSYAVFKDSKMLREFDTLGEAQSYIKGLEGKR